jgi:hypothetical protein
MKNTTSGKEKEVPIGERLSGGEYPVPRPKKTLLENWQRGTPCVHGGISYRYYQSKIQANGTILDKGCGKWNVATNFSGAPVFPWSTPHCDAQFAMNIGRKPSKAFPRFKLGENIILTKTTKPIVNKASCDDIFWCFHASLKYLPDEVMGGSTCCLQERLAYSLGGVKMVVDEKEMKFLWFFDTPDLAVQHLMFCIICLVGSTPFYKRIRHRALKRLGGVKNGKVAVVGYSVVGCKPTPPGTIAYYLLANTGVTEDGNQPELVIAFPTRAVKGTHNKKKQASNKVSKGKLLFVRLM